MTMRTLTTLVLLTGIAVAGSSAISSPPDPIRVVTYNIRFDNPSDGVNAWSIRRDRVVRILDSTDADVIGLQEALVGQIRDVARALPGYDWVGVGRDDGATGGEHSPVFYRRDRFERLDWGTVWLSATPDSIGSVGWDAALPRIATWLRLRSIESAADILVVNTHFDHVGEIARRESARLLRALFPPGGEWVPYVLMGDFNVVDTTASYRILVSGDRGLTDAWSVAGRPEPAGTFTGFDGSSDRRIDYVFVSAHWDVVAAAVPDRVRDGLRPSDHRPVVADLVLR